MDPMVLEARDAAVVTGDKGTVSAWHDEARSWMSQRPESNTARGTNCADRCNDKVSAKFEDPETPEVKAAYKNMLEKTKGVDPVAVADSLNLFGDLAATGANVSKMSESFQKDKDLDKKVDPRVNVSPEAVEPQVANAYGRLLQRGFNPVLIVDVLNVAGDVAAIATSPQGKKLFEDIKTLIGHIKG